MLEWPEDYEPEFNWEIISTRVLSSSGDVGHTIDVDEASSMTDKSFGREQEVVKADAKSNLLDYFVCIFGVDVVFYG